jgi:predicted RNase H-like nuclease
MVIVGIDLAWGEKKSDGVCFIRYRPSTRQAWVAGYAYPQGDDALIDALAAELPQAGPAFVAIDAPLVCPNVTGSRPVDRLTHTLFHREHAACHPSNLTKCPRPPRVLARLATELGFAAGWQAGKGVRLAVEVYPHPAMVRLFKLSRIIKYKKGPVAAKRREFHRLQELIVVLIAAEFAFLALDGETEALLRERWTKPVEDRVDAFFCALIALWHIHHKGRRSEVIGDVETGFILLPADLREKSL